MNKGIISIRGDTLGHDSLDLRHFLGITFGIRGAILTKGGDLAIYANHYQVTRCDESRDKEPTCDLYVPNVWCYLKPPDLMQKTGLKSHPSPPTLLQKPILKQWHGINLVSRRALLRLTERDNGHRKP